MDVLRNTNGPHVGKVVLYVSLTNTPLDCQKYGVIVKEPTVFRHGNVTEADVLLLDGKVEHWESYLLCTIESQISRLEEAVKHMYDTRSKLQNLYQHSLGDDT